MVGVPYYIRDGGSAWYIVSDAGEIAGSRQSLTAAHVIRDLLTLGEVRRAQRLLSIAERPRKLGAGSDLATKLRLRGILL